MNEKRQKPEKTPKWLRIAGWVIFAGLVFSMVQSTFSFLIIMKFPLLGWIFFNACVVGSLIWVIGFVFRWRWLTMASLPFMLFFGGGGLFMFGWQQMMLFGQISHIFMMLGLIHAITDAFCTRGWKRKVFGLIGGIVVFTGFVIVQQSYTRNHPELWERMGVESFDARSGASERYNDPKEE